MSEIFNERNFQHSTQRRMAHGSSERERQRERKRDRDTIKGSQAKRERERPRLRVRERERDQRPTARQGERASGHSMKPRTGRESGVETEQSDRQGEKD